MTTEPEPTETIDEAALRFIAEQAERRLYTLKRFGDVKISRPPKRGQLSCSVDDCTHDAQDYADVGMGSGVQLCGEHLDELEGPERFAVDLDKRGGTVSIMGIRRLT